MTRADARIGSLVGRVEAMLRAAAPRITDAAADAAADAAEVRREAADIVTALVDRPRHWASVHRDAIAPDELLRAATVAAERRAAGMPLAYAVGQAAFRHLTLRVDERVLIPRPETEGLVDLVLERVAPGGIAVDVGTGSGAIALALASEGRFERVIGTDVSVDALAVARDNGRRLADAGVLTAAVEWRSGALLAPVRGVRARAVVSNPPYIAPAEADELPADVRGWEPPIALFSGAGGLAATAAIVGSAADVLERGGLLALEVDARRASTVGELVSADRRYVEVAVRLDLAGRERYITARRASGG